MARAVKISGVSTVKIPDRSSGKGVGLKFDERKSKELVLGFAGPIGCGIPAVITEIERLLKGLGYRVHRIKLSDYLGTLLSSQKLTVNEQLFEGKSEAFKKVRRLQEAGRLLREDTENPAILAEYAIRKIVEHRGIEVGVNRDGDPIIPEKVAYLIDQIKRPEEVSLLRAVYRNLFYFIGVTKDYDARKLYICDGGFNEQESSEIIDIDRSEDSKEGQRLDKALHLADYFVSGGIGDGLLSSRLTKFLALMHGDNSITPTDIEQGMYAAYAAGLRSGCFSRQVGAAIVNSSGEVLATGCNDVPRSGGGLYREGLAPDHRCVKMSDQHCFNDFYKKQMRDKIGKEIQDFLIKNYKSSINIDGLLKSINDNTGLGDLIEFSRAVHAEMDAITSLARNGGGSTKDTSLFTTTFPCHNCARHIIAAGIKRVFYIEPYDKSKARELHADAIEFDHGQTQPQSGSERVRFTHYEGVSPRQFQNFFKANKRKDEDGNFIKISLGSAPKMVPEYLDNYLDFETKAVEHFQQNASKYL